ncbi:unnamed protein product [Nyctereutes procyonoides]|uniref:(raccoon dog) hypothetical protein n=1 Tax=Nyctereutes procyonoides TaxID=34880 RepID=A0A811Z4Q0_NYCPR|nr:unnamed protein product [Nyctereutes procyonoides]
MEAWAGWVGAEVTPVSPADFPSIPGACGHSLGNALGWSLGFPAGGGGESWQKGQCAQTLLHRYIELTPTSTSMYAHSQSHPQQMLNHITTQTFISYPFACQCREERWLSVQGGAGLPGGLPGGGHIAAGPGWMGTGEKEVWEASLGVNIGASNAQPSGNFIPWGWRVTGGSAQGGHEHDGRGQERHRGTRMGEPGRKLRPTRACLPLQDPEMPPPAWESLCSTGHRGHSAWATSTPHSYLQGAR